MFNFLKKKAPADRKVMVIGLDCAAPELVFDKFRDELPTLRKLYEGGIWGQMESCIPAITVPAWASMMSSKDPGTLGVYGFRNRRDYTYDNMIIANGSMIKEERVWDLVGDAGKKVVTIGVPQTFPMKPVNGVSIGDFLAPSSQSDFTYPSELREKLLSLAPRYEVDVRNFRTPDKDWLVQQIWDMTEQRFEALNWLMESQPWDYFMWVEMGVDRIHHGLWSY